MDRRDDPDFYVGYQKRAPARLARFVRGRILALYAVVAVVAVVLVLAQGRFAQAFFEFGHARSFDGFISEYPYPTLLVRRPAVTNGELPFSRYLLSAFGKHGADSLVAGLDGQRVRLDGTLIHRDGQTMIEIESGSVEAIADTAGASPDAGTSSAGRFELSGEIVDSKCYLGVMKPGHRKPHRACAIRCISGGIPPIFVVRAEDGGTMQMLLVGEDDRTLNDEVLPFVADPLRLEGEIVRDGGLLILRTEPASFRRLTAGSRS